jgi:hypothetical protein
MIGTSLRNSTPVVYDQSMVYKVQPYLDEYDSEEEDDTSECDWDPPSDCDEDNDSITIVWNPESNLITGELLPRDADIDFA